jgi:hypothetical protein
MNDTYIIRLYALLSYTFSEAPEVIGEYLGKEVTQEKPLFI